MVFPSFYFANLIIHDPNFSRSIVIRITGNNKFFHSMFYSNIFNQQTCLCRILIPTVWFFYTITNMTNILQYLFSVSKPQIDMSNIVSVPCNKIWNLYSGEKPFKASPSLFSYKTTSITQSLNISQSLNCTVFTLLPGAWLLNMILLNGLVIS